MLKVNKKLGFISTISLLSLTMSGCTALLWTDSFNSSKTVTTYKSLAKDKVVAFAQVQNNNPQLEKGSLVMVGENYWYTFTAATSKHLFKYLRTDLPRPYTIYNANIKDKNMPKNTLPVNVSKNGNFSTGYCLRYTLDPNNKSVAAKEAKILKSLNFTSSIEYANVRDSQGKLLKMSDRRRAVYRHCISAKGTYFKARKDINIEYTFETPIPVAIQHKTKHRKSNLGEALYKVLLTPFAVAGDVVLVPVMGVCFGVGACRIKIM